MPENNSLVKNKSKFEIRCTNPDLSQIIDKIDNITPISIPMHHNLSPQEIQAIKEFKSFTDIIIKKADKSNTMIVMDNDFYRNKLVLQGHLRSSTYESTDNKADKKSYEKYVCINPKI